MTSNSSLEGIMKASGILPSQNRKAIPRIEPKLVAEELFPEWTADSSISHLTFQRMSRREPQSKVRGNHGWRLHIESDLSLFRERPENQWPGSQNTGFHFMTEHRASYDLPISLYDRRNSLYDRTHKCFHPSVFGLSNLAE
jgi:hypothetical protein